MSDITILSSLIIKNLDKEIHRAHKESAHTSLEVSMARITTLEQVKESIAGALKEYNENYKHCIPDDDAIRQATSIHIPGH